MSEQSADGSLESVHFQNFRVLRDTVLPLTRFTLIVGPNGSGKSTAIQALEIAGGGNPINRDRAASAGLPENAEIKVTLKWRATKWHAETSLRWGRSGWGGRTLKQTHATPAFTDWPATERALDAKLNSLRSYSLNANAVAEQVGLAPQMELTNTGAGLAGVLDRLRDEAPERFEALNAELARWLPEFDRILFATPERGHRIFLLRTSDEQHAIPADDLSQGTVLSLAMLTLAYLPTPPSIVCLEEPDRGIHPRLLRDVRDALYRLSFPEEYGEDREPVQVIATTHSPYLLDLFRDHPEQIVIAEKTGTEARFERLSDRPDVEEILHDTPLGEAWYSGVLGGVPIER
ncbi:MAG: AAA family ATPase [Planctomycetes bacterium]|nr:AAA family ATPase [Planctomycetota bacterium]